MTELVYGPLNKNIYTHLLELITKCMIHASDKVKSFSDYSNQSNDKKPVELKLGNIHINLNDIMSKANLAHISVNETDSAKLNKYSYYSKYCNDPLNHAEKCAITEYTGSRYYSINQFLHSQATGGHYNVNDIVIDSVLIASGLNKITPTLNSDLQSYRGEHSTSAEEIQHRIELVKQGGGWTDQNAFMSTSTDYYVSQNFKGNCFIIFDDIYGKNIQSLSGIPSEDEFLIAPGKILWTGYEYVNGDHIFQARIVNPLIEGADDASIEYYQLFDNLLNFAKENGVNDDFVTPELKATLDNYRESGLLNSLPEIFTKPHNENASFDDNIYQNYDYDLDLNDTFLDFNETQFNELWNDLLNQLSELDVNDIVLEDNRPQIETLSLNDCISFDNSIAGLDLPQNTTTGAIMEPANLQPLPVIVTMQSELLMPLVQEQLVF